jgi:hemerythrin
MRRVAFAPASELAEHSVAVMAMEVPPYSARRLATDHTAFERTFFSILARARSGDWHELDEVWDELVDDLERHFRFEETHIFPAYAERGDDCRVLVEQLRDEHTQVRHSLDELGVRIQLHETPTVAIEELLKLLRKHAEIENQRIYPWAIAAGEATALGVSC